MASSQVKTSAKSERKLSAVSSDSSSPDSDVTVSSRGKGILMHRRCCGNITRTAMKKYVKVALASKKKLRSASKTSQQPLMDHTIWYV